MNILIIVGLIIVIATIFIINSNNVINSITSKINKSNAKDIVINPTEDIPVFRDNIIDIKYNMLDPNNENNMLDINNEYDILDLDDENNMLDINNEYDILDLDDENNMLDLNNENNILDSEDENNMLHSQTDLLNTTRNLQNMNNYISYQNNSSCTNNDIKKQLCKFISS
jgi:hypothetical protein